MRMSRPSRLTSLLSVLLLLCSSFGVTKGSKLRGTRTIRRLNKDGLLLTEGRKGGDRKEYNGESGAVPKGYEDSVEEVASYEEGNDGGTKQKGEMKVTVKGEATSSKKAKGDSEPEMKIKETEESESLDDPIEPPEPPSSPSPPAKESSRPSKGGATKGAGSKASTSEDYAVKESGGAAKESGGTGMKGNKEVKEDDDGDYADENGGRKVEPVSTPADYAGIPEIPEYPETANSMAQVAFVLTRFGLEFQLGNAMATVPQTKDFAEVEAATIAYLEEYIQLTYNNEDQMVFFDSAAIEAISRRTGGSGGTPFVDFEANVAFLEDSPIIPTSHEISLTVAEALSGTNQAAYLFALAQKLSSGNPFLSTTLVTVYVPDSQTSSNPRVSSSSTTMSAAGIAAAASTGVITLIVGGYLLFKIKNENIDIQNRFAKGYTAGNTLAGETYDTSTLEASAAMPTDDAQSLDSTLYNDDGSIYSTTMPTPTDHVQDDRSEASSSQMSLEKSVKAEMSKDADTYYENESFDVSPTPTDEYGVDDAHIQTKIGAYASIIGRTRALVPTLQTSPPMSNADIKNYFKSKYNCKSPRGYEAVDELKAASQEEVDDDDDEDEDDDESLGDAEIQDSRSLELPALDHDMINSQQQRIKKRGYDAPGDGEEYIEEEIIEDSSQPSDEGKYREVFGDELVEEDYSVSAQGLVARSQAEVRKTEEMSHYADVVPHLPGELSDSSNKGRRSRDANVHDEDNDSINTRKSLDDVSLATMK